MSQTPFRHIPDTFQTPSRHLYSTIKTPKKVVFTHIILMFHVSRILVGSLLLLIKDDLVFPVCGSRWSFWLSFQVQKQLNMKINN